MIVYNHDAMELHDNHVIEFLYDQEVEQHLHEVHDHHAHVTAWEEYHYYNLSGIYN